MRCYKHTDREGTGSCAICGKTLCDECQIHLGNQVVCKSCVASLIPDNDPQEMVDKAKDEKEKNKEKSKKSLFGFLKRNKSNDNAEKPKRKTQSTVNQYPYGELNSHYEGEVIHEETYDYWDETELPKAPEPEFAYEDKNPLFQSDSYAIQSEKPKSPRNIFKRHKMEKPEKKMQTKFEGDIASEEIVIDHSDDEPSQLETLLIEPDEPEIAYDSYYDEEKKIVEDFKAQAKESEAPNLNSIVIDHTDDESSQIKDYNPQYEEPSLKEEMENIIDRSNEIIEEQNKLTEETSNNTQFGGETVTQLNKNEIEDLIYQLHKEGNSPSKIGIILRDQYNVPNIKAATGQKLTKIIKEKEELENKGTDDSDMSITSAEASSIINTENNMEDEEKSRPALKPFDDINGPQVFNYEDGAPVEETEEKVVKTPQAPITEEPITEPIKEEIKEATEPGEIIIEKTPEELELLEKIQNEKVQEPPETPPITQITTKTTKKSTTAASSKVEPVPITPQVKPQKPENVIEMNSIIDSSMFVKSYIDNYSMLPSSVRIEHKKWNMAEYLYYAVTSTVNITQEITNPIDIKSLIEVLHTKDEFKFGTITIEDYLFLAKTIQAYIDSEGRAPFNMQTPIGTLQFRTLVYLFASVLTIYKFTNKLPETYLINDNVFKVEDDEYNETTPTQQAKGVIPPISTPDTVAAQTPQETIPEPEPTPENIEIPIENIEETPQNLIDELQKHIQDYKNKKLEDEESSVEEIEPKLEEPIIDNGVERTRVPVPEPIEEPEAPVQDTIITPTKEENPSVSNIKRLMHNSSKNSQQDEELEAQHTIEELEKTKHDGVGNLKENYIDNRTRELKENPHKLTRSSQSPMPRPKEVIRGKKELIQDDLKYTPNDEKIRPRFEEEEPYMTESDEDYTEMGDWLIFLISFIVFLVVFGAIAYFVYVTYFQATFGTPAEILSSLLKSI